MTQPVYQDLIHEIVNEVRSSRSEEDSSDIHVKLVPLKTRDRALERAEDDYAQRLPGPPFTFLYDIVRGSLEFSSAKDLLDCLERIENHPMIHIVKAKNRFRSPGLTGYRDINLQFQIPVESVNGSFRYVCELQLHQKELKQLGVELGSHKHYQYFRTYFAGSTNTLEERLEDLKVIQHGGQQASGTMLTELLDKDLDEDRLERLGKLFHEQLVELPMALGAYRKVLTLRLQNYGDEHASIAKTYHYMAGILVHQGKLDKAMALYQVSLDIKVKLNGSEDPSIAETLQRMAMLLRDLDKLDESMMLYQKTLRIQTKAFHEDHLSVGTTCTIWGCSSRSKESFPKPWNTTRERCGSSEQVSVMNIRQSGKFSVTWPWSFICNANTKNHSECIGGR